MGFWSGLGKVLSVAAPVVAAPFTGGASLTALKAALPAVIGGAGAALSGMGAASSQNRGQQDAQNLNRDALRLRDQEQFERAQMDRATLELKQREEARAAQKEAFALALRSALASNLQDVSFDRSGFRSPVADIRFSGGARPSALGPQGREAASVMNNQALQSLMAPTPFSSVPAPQRVQMSEPSKASFWEKLAGPLGMGLSVAGMGLDAANKRTPAQPPGVSTFAGLPGMVPGTAIPLPGAPPPQPFSFPAGQF